VAASLFTAACVGLALLAGAGLGPPGVAEAAPCTPIAPNQSTQFLSCVYNGQPLPSSDGRGSNFTRDTFNGADLTGSAFSNATFTGATLNGANLTCVNLFQANLTSATLDGANLTGANLFGATWVATTWSGSTTWSNTTCPDGSNSTTNAGTCAGHFGAPAVGTTPITTACGPAPGRIDPALLQQMATDRARPLPIIVEMAPPRPPFASGVNQQLAQRALALLQLYGQPVGALALINAAAGFAPAAGIEQLSRAPDVAYIYSDATVRAWSAPAGPATEPIAEPAGMLSAAYPQAVRADDVWGLGTTGRGVTVAVLDSGVAPDPDLTQPVSRLLAAVSFAGARDPQRPDAGGHGTHVAGIVAGAGTRSAGEYVGVAPGANVVDVRVLNRDGSGRVSSVVRGIEWVLAHRAQYNIRIINLSLGASSSVAYRQDPLAAAVEIAWKRGVVVVAAAGNRGPAGGTVDTPGIDPFVVTVGATDDHDTPRTGDDALAWFSSWGAAAGLAPKPELVAPGRRIVSLRVPGSTLDALYPDRVVTARTGATYFRLSGTSMAAPIVSGAAALLLERQPSLRPDQVKALLTAGAQAYGQTSGVRPPDAAADGAGSADAYVTARITSPPAAANRGLRPADGLARALYPILYGQPLVWNDPTSLGINWSLLRWDNLAWDNLAWDNLAWDNLAWDNLAWDNLAWDNLAWDNLAWDNLAWDNLALD
jgi:serine protease AprX